MKTDENGGMEELFRSDECIIFHDFEVPCLVVEWHGYVPKERFRRISDLIPDFLRAKKLSKLLADDSYLESMMSIDQERIFEEWLPSAIKAGYKAGAIVPSKSYFTRVTVEETVKLMQGEVTIKFFDNRRAAKQWLKTLEI